MKHIESSGCQPFRQRSFGFAARASDSGLLYHETDQADLLVLHDLVEAGSLVPVIDRQYELSDVPASLTYLAEGHAQGKIVINVIWPPFDKKS
jgi:NADPH:quinone reductase-like Zn-dependent oxidoreductase